MQDSSSTSDSHDENEQAWQETRADLLQIHRNVEDILQLRAVRLFVILGRDDYTAILNSSVLNVMRRGGYGRALANLRDFILENPVLDKILPELMDNAEPGLTALDKWAEQYRLSELL